MPLKIGTIVSTEILLTKLYIPQPVPGMVARPRLLTRLDNILHTKLTLISAPAGFGKTTLISQWLHHHQPPLPAAWLSLEEAENDPIRFCDYFIAALQTIFPETGKNALTYLHSAVSVPLDSTLTSLINEITNTSTNFVFILDDFQFIHSEAVHNAVSFLIQHLPPTMHLIIATRVDPPLPMSGLRGKGTILEIRSDDLRFTQEETAALLAEMDSPQLSKQDIGMLQQRTEGWVVGLKMAGLVMRGQQEASTFVSGFTGNQRYIMDYLVDEVLQHQSPEIINFLLRTSVLERFCAPLCDAVIKQQISKQILSTIEKANLFLIPLDSSGDWYRYHHLFRDLLQHRLRSEADIESIHDIYRRSSLWYESNGFFENAIEQSLAAQDWEKAMDLIGTPKIQARWVSSLTMLNWLKQIPLALLLVRPLRYLNYVYALQGTGQQDEAKKNLEYLKEICVDDKLIQGSITMLCSAIALTDGDFGKMGEYAQKTLSLLHEHDNTNADRDWNFRVVRADASQKLSLLYYQQARFVEAESLLELCLNTYREVGFTSATCYPAAMLAVIIHLRGKPRDAIKLIQDTIIPFPEDPATVLAYSALGSIHYGLNDLQSAASSIEMEIKLIQLLKIAPSTMLPNAYLYLAIVKMAIKDVAGSNRALAEADRLLPDIPDEIARNAAFHATTAMIAGYEKTASEWFRKFTQYKTVPLMDMTPIAIYMYQIRNGTAKLLEEEPIYFQQFKAQGLWNLAMLARIYQALASVQNVDKAIEYLAEALALGKSQECIRTFVDFGAPMASLLRKAIAQGIETDYARKLLDIIEDEERWRQNNRIKTRISTQNNTLLSIREMEILTLLAEGLSNQQIADKLTISLNTVKTHVYRVFDKLEAKHRGEAIARARELELL